MNAPYNNGDIALQIVTLCDVELRVPENDYDTPIDLVFCLGDLDDGWMSNRVEQLNRFTFHNQS